MKRNIDEAFAVFDDEEDDEPIHYETITASMHPALSELKKMKPEFNKTVEITDELSQSVEKEYAVTSDFQGKTEQDQTLSSAVNNDTIVLSHQVSGDC